MLTEAQARSRRSNGCAVLYIAQPQKNTRPAGGIDLDLLCDSDCVASVQISM